MLQIESPADRAGLFFDGADEALFAQVPDARDEQGAVIVMVERIVPCRFDRSYQVINGHEGYRPVMLCQDTDLAYIKKDHSVVLKGHVWSIAERQPDGLGLTLCLIKHLGRFSYANAATTSPAYPYTVSAFIDTGATYTN